MPETTAPREVSGSAADPGARRAGAARSTGGHAGWPRAAVGWLLAPATEQVPPVQAVGAAAVRLLAGFLWLYNVTWKNAPDFGADTRTGLYQFTAYAVSHPVFPPFSWLVEHVVLPNFAPFGWAVLAAETALAVLLLTGAWVRLAAALGIAQAVAITLSVAVAPNEWPWSYFLLIGLHVALLTGSAGRVLAVDAVRAGTSTGRSLGLAFGGFTALIGLNSAVRSFGDPLAAHGPGLHSDPLQVGLGDYNLLGGLVLVVTGALLVLLARGGARPLGWAAAGLAGLAAVSLYAQLGFTDPILGGSTTSAAWYVAVAVVAAALARTAGARTAGDRTAGRAAA